MESIPGSAATFAEAVHLTDPPEPSTGNSDAGPPESCRAGRRDGADAFGREGLVLRLRRAGRALRVAARRARPSAVPATPEPVPPSAEDLRHRREEELLALHPGLVRERGLVTEVRDDLLAADAFLRSFTEITDVLRTRGITFAPIPRHGSRQWVVIPPGLRADVLAACATAFRSLPVYADLLGHDHTHRTVLADELPDAVAELEGHTKPAAATADRAESIAPEPAPVRVKGVRLYRPVVTSGRSLFYGHEYGCDLDFWDSAQPSEGAIAAIHEPPFGWWTPSLAADSTVRIADRDFPVPATFTRARLNDITFPVDAVITWVDDGDPAWRARRAAALTARPDLPGPPSSGTGDERFRNRDELRYCLRSIAMYAPWIRHIHLVTDDQLPHWLATEHPDLTVVHHRELFTDPSTLPVFNSHAIETQLHRIPALAEHFLYFNDDMFLGRPLRPEQFFQGNGVPLVNLDSRVIPPGPVTASDDEYVAAQKNTRALVHRRFGRDTTNTLRHTPYPLTRTLLTESAEDFAAELADTARSVFRSPTDIAPITLAVARGYLTGHVAWGRLGHHDTDIGRQAQLDRLPALLHDRATDTFSLNDGALDHLDHLDRAEQDRAITAFLQDYFPVPGPFEATPPLPTARRPATDQPPEPGP
ncbi:Stealth CR1 domain-containing protein [Kitasatospora sp. NPDC059747]|uniref:Stealth CR1 domain-containing protein n=1 Tax=Kitasatospora sp. NPDC059747 TaxID=3346930 RepID=UPI003655000F